VVVVQVDDERADRNLLLAARRAPARRVLQAIEEPIQTLRHGVVRVGRQQVDAFVRGAERAGSAVGAEVAPERLRRAALDARQDRFGARGESIASVARLPALFLAFLQRWHRGALPYAYQDQGMDEAVAHAICDAADPVVALCSDVGLWGDIAGDQRLIDAVRRANERVARFVQAASGHRP